MFFTFPKNHSRTQIVFMLFLEMSHVIKCGIFCHHLQYIVVRKEMSRCLYISDKFKQSENRIATADMKLTQIIEMTARVTSYLFCTFVHIYAYA